LNQRIRIMNYEFIIYEFQFCMIEAINGGGEVCSFEVHCANLNERQVNKEIK